jgi:hypothetical protein
VATGPRRPRAPVDDEYDIRFANSEAADGWEHLSRHAPGNLRRAFEKIRANPHAMDAPERQHRLKGKLGTTVFKGSHWNDGSTKLPAVDVSGTSSTTPPAPSGSPMLGPVIPRSQSDDLGGTGRETVPRSLESQVTALRSLKIK